ncbi:G3E family GTPase [Neobacillus niacini]|uniref:GTP-binding protein n=1 Tax=Neobacillus niacini TaxID=86668 RepID=UPI002782305A|nr:GTP-binding protein [Neobacillus niacini]MDQ0999742.1 G3E family GTPase [Neobacillus niacini]
MNKVDKISEQKQKEIENELQTLNPSAKILPTMFADIDISLHNTNPNGRAEHVKTHAIEFLHINTYVHTFSQPINKELFEEFLRTMPDSIYRIKGYIRFLGTQATYLFQYAYGMPLHTKSGLNIKNTLVFIGDRLNREYLQNALKNLELKSEY